MLQREQEKGAREDSLYHAVVVTPRFWYTFLTPCVNLVLLGDL